METKSGPQKYQIQDELMSFLSGLDLLVLAIVQAVIGKKWELELENVHLVGGQHLENIILNLLFALLVDWHMPELLHRTQR